jgi:hypothetical protein
LANAILQIVKALWEWKPGTHANLPQETYVELEASLKGELCEVVNRDPSLWIDFCERVHTFSRHSGNSALRMLDLDSSKF